VVDEIADRLRDVVDRHGPNAVAIYIGTSSAAYPAMGSIAAALITALGSKMIFSAASIDQPGTRIADALHGLWLGGRTPFDDVDAFLFAGTNPVISKQFLAEEPGEAPGARGRAGHEGRRHRPATYRDGASGRTSTFRPDPAKTRS